MNPLLSKLIAPIKQFFQKEDWKKLVGGWGVLFAFLALPLILGYWIPKAVALGYIISSIFIIGLIYSFYIETKRKIEAGEQTYKVTYVIFKSMDVLFDFGRQLIAQLGIYFLVFFTLVVGIAVIGGVIGILVFGWKQLL